MQVPQRAAAEANVLGVAVSVEEALRASEERYRTLFEESRDAIYVTRPDGAILDLNRAGVRLLGLTSREEALRRNAREFYPDPVQRDTATRALAEHGVLENSELTLRRADGKLVTVLESATAVRDAEGRVVAYRGILHDITDRKAAEDALRDSEARLKGIVASAMDPIITVDSEQRITLFNAAAERLFGYRAETVLGEPLDMLVPERFRTAHRRHLEAFAQTGVTMRAMGHQVPLTALRADGTEVPIEAAISQVVVGGQHLFTVILRDISERLEIERQKDEFLAAVSHDLKNPLTAVLGATQLLRRQFERPDLLDPERVQRGLAGVESAAHRMAVLLNELLDQARLRLDRPLELERRETDLVALACQAAEEQQQATERHSLRLEFGEPQLIGRWDAQRLERVVGNLLDNAVKYSPYGGEIVVSVERVADERRAWALLRVRDHGVGIAEADLPHLFEHFRRGRNVGRISGSGLGLATARQIVEQHGGAISVESQEGRGSTFTVRLPLSAP